jgi:uncharacterized protein
MILNLTQVTSGKLSKMTFSHRVIPEIEEKTSFGINAINEFDIEGQVTNNGSVIEIDYTIKGDILYECSRCLDLLTRTFEKHVIKTIFRTEPSDSEDEEWYVSEDHLFNVEEIVVDEIVAELPYRVVCSEACRGLCPNCGINLNHKSCSCADDKVDPRLEILKNFFTQE